MIWFLGCTSQGPFPSLSAIDTSLVNGETDDSTDSGEDTDTEPSCSGTGEAVTNADRTWTHIGLGSEGLTATDEDGFPHTWYYDPSDVQGPVPVTKLRRNCGVGPDGTGSCFLASDYIVQGVGPVSQVSSWSAARCWVDTSGAATCEGAEDALLPTDLDAQSVGQIYAFEDVTGYTSYTTNWVIAEVVTTDGDIVLVDWYGSEVLASGYGFVDARFPDAEPTNGVAPLMIGILPDGEIALWADVPTVQPNPGERYLDVAQAGDAVCGVTVDGALECWEAVSPSVSEPYPDAAAWVLAHAPTGGSFVEVEGGLAYYSHELGVTGIMGCWGRFCALDTEGAITCWGRLNDLGW